MKKTTEQFIAKAKKIHGDRYDYSKTKYISARDKVTIICPEHGPFEQEADSHTRGCGCPLCANKRRGDSHKSSQDDFIKKARKVHGQRYDYSEAVYAGSHANLKIICKIHGPFYQVASTHLSGAGCPACSGVARLDTDKFIQRAKEIHGDKYDYHLVDFKNSKTKVKIICPEHGLFEQIPSNHLQGMGCLLCGQKNAGQYHKKDTDSFIAEARVKHGDRYDYSQTEYKGAREKLTIICPIHGPFEQVASSHLHKDTACLKCSYAERAEKARMTFDEFLKRSKKNHIESYDYSIAKKEFTGASKKLTIICPIHGPFVQTGVDHLMGKGCPKCGYERGGKANSKSTEIFIREAREVHGDKYDYSKTEYINAYTNVIIICPIDGEFEQNPWSHINGTGCPKCSRRNQGAPRNLTRALRGEFDDKKDAYLYIVSFKFPSTDAILYKVGSGTGTRFKAVQNTIRNAGGTEIQAKQYPFPNMGEAIVFEYLAHEQISDHKFIMPSDLKFPGYSEVYTKRPNLATIKKHPTLIRFRTGERWNPKES